VQQRRGRTAAAFIEPFSLHMCIHPQQPSSTLTQDKGLANAASIQCTDGFGHAAQLQVGKGMTLLTKAVSQISTDLYTKVELASESLLPSGTDQFFLSGWECRVSDF